MRKIVFLFLLSACSCYAQDILSTRYTLPELKRVLIPYNDFTPFPRIENRSAWQKADQELLESYLKRAEGYLDYTWPYIPATKSLLIHRTGDRNEYQKVSFEKREVLGLMLLAEIYENKGRFVDPIINGVWSICEESFWGAPAHLPQTQEISGLVDVTQPPVDLFAAETATMLAWTDYFLGEKFDKVSPQIRKRIYYETNSRIFNRLMEKDHGWMRSNANGRRPNNWNPWICSNWINSVLLLEKDNDKRAASVYRALDVLDEFLTPHPKDGGCDEGPSYWGAAAASLYDNIALLNQATNNAFQYVYADEKVKNMAKFIYRAQISEKYFLNFADADPQPGLSAEMIYRFGKDIGDAEMMKFGAYYLKPATGSLGRFHFFRNFYSLFMQEEFKSSSKALPLPKDVWLPDTQVMAARDVHGTTKGFYVAAKGGHNDESHNHNDIGNYVVYYDGYPLLIDVGRGTYTRKTFSARRYDIWYNCSDYHNVPSINGKTQLPGSQYRASNVQYRQSKNASRFSLDIAKAYPAEAGINQWNRTVTLNRGKNVIVQDVFSLNNASQITQHLMTCHPAEVKKRGELVIHYKDEKNAMHDFIVVYDPGKMEPTIEKVPLVSPEDEGVRTKWGDTIYRINFKVLDLNKDDQLKFEIKKV